MKRRSTRKPRFCQFDALVSEDGRTVLLFALDTSGQLWWRSLHGEAWVPMRMDRSTDAVKP